MRINTFWTATLALIVSILSPTLYAQDDQWKFAASPYFWAAGLEGNFRQLDLPEASLDFSFKDIWSDLDASFMGVAEARKGRVSLFGDLLYSKISSGVDTPFGLLANRIGVKTETLTAMLGAGYNLLDSSRNVLDLNVALRYWDASTTLSYSGAFLDGRSFEDGDRWLDLLIGLRGLYFFKEHVYISGWALVGAGEADFDWDSALLIGYQFNENWSLSAGYRALGVKFSKDHFGFDATQQGPLIGLVWRL